MLDNSITQRITDMKTSEFHLNVYLTDKKWTWVDEFWSASTWGLPVGGIRGFAAGELYNKAVRIKRMS